VDDLDVHSFCAHDPGGSLDQTHRVRVGSVALQGTVEEQCGEFFEGDSAKEAFRRLVEGIGSVSA
jgi:hypothetical protein